MADDSEKIGHYLNSNAKNDLERTGERKFGGLDGFVGNTCKIVKDSNSESGCSILGGNYRLSGKRYPASYCARIRHFRNLNFNSICLLELRK